ncbi:MAG TPA: hypothetical protein VGI39_41965 [Polyangiaceae bacterium]|jgi:hypothetical protein
MNRKFRIGLFTAASILGTGVALTATTTAHAASFDVAAPGCGRSIGVGPGGDAWVTGCSPNPGNGGGASIYQLQSRPHQQESDDHSIWHRSFVQIDGQDGAAATQVAVSPEGTAWVLNAQGNIYAFNGVGFSQYPGCATSIGVGSNENVWVIGCSTVGDGGKGIYRLVGSQFVQVDAADGAAGTKIAVSPEGTAWVLNAQGNIYKWTGSKFQQYPGCATSIGAGPNDGVWVIGCSEANGGGNGIYQLQGSSFVPMGAGAAGTAIAVSPEGTPWVLNSSGTIYEYDSDASDTSPIQISQQATTPGGDAAGGWVNLTINRDGSYVYSGHIHDSGFPSYNVSTALGVRAANGTLFTFTAQGHVDGTQDPFGNRDYNWSTSGTNPDLAANWADLKVNYEFFTDLEPDWDFVQAWQTLSTVITDISKVVSVVGPILASL